MIRQYQRPETRLSYTQRSFTALEDLWCRDRVLAPTLLSFAFVIGLESGPVQALDLGNGTGTGTNHIAISDAAGLPATANGNQSVAVGANSTAGGQIAAASGFGSSASGAGSSAYGAGSSASGFSSSAYGAGSSASGFSSSPMAVKATPVASAARP